MSPYRTKANVAHFIDWLLAGAALALVGDFVVDVSLNFFQALLALWAAKFIVELLAFAGGQASARGTIVESEAYGKALADGE